MNVSLQFEPLDCSFYDWPSDIYAVQQPLVTKTNGTENENAAKRQKQSLRCRHAIDELLQTERDYTNHLTHLVEVCFDQILARQKWILDKHKTTIVRNANVLLHFHKSLLLALEHTTMIGGGSTSKDVLARCGHIATVFLDMGSNFTLYDTYCDKHDAAIALCNEYRSKPEWVGFTRECATPTDSTDAAPRTGNTSAGSSGSDQMTKPLHFEDYLIKPVQRVCRYQLLLKEILHYTPRGTTEYRRLDCALGMMHAVVAGIDRRKYHRDTTERTRLFIDRLDTSCDGRLDKDSLYLLGNLVMAGVIDVTYTSLGQTTISSSRSKYLGCFIFPTYLIMVRAKKVTSYTPKHWFPLRLVEVEDLQDIQDQREYAFVVRCKKHCFAFTASCQREKKLWLAKLSQAIATAKSQPRSADNFMVSSLHGVAKPAKIRTSRSVTNLLDFSGRDSTSSSASSNATTLTATSSTSSSSSSSCSSPYSTSTWLQHSDSTIKRSKSLSLQLVSYYQSSSNPPSPASPKLPTLLPPLPTPTTTTTTTTTTKRHSADFSPRTKRRDQLKTRIHSEMYIKPPNLIDPTTRRRQSVDLMSTSSSQLSLTMIGKIKNNHQHALRMSSDHKLRDVCTQDYLSSRSWSTLLRESSNGPTHYTTSSNPSTTTSSNSSNTGDGVGRRKASFSNLRSSTSSFSLLMSPSRRVSDGSMGRQDHTQPHRKQHQQQPPPPPPTTTKRLSTSPFSYHPTIDRTSRLSQEERPPTYEEPKKSLRSTLQPVKHCFVDGFRRLSPRQEIPRRSSRIFSWIKQEDSPTTDSSFSSSSTSSTKSTWSRKWMASKK